MTFYLNLSNVPTTSMQAVHGANHHSAPLHI